jgi:hypothetical protein
MNRKIRVKQPQTKKHQKNGQKKDYTMPIVKTSLVFHFFLICSRDNTTTALKCTSIYSGRKVLLNFSRFEKIYR